VSRCPKTHTTKTHTTKTHTTKLVYLFNVCDTHEQTERLTDRYTDKHTHRLVDNSQIVRLQIIRLTDSKTHR
jgi:hypothetical protein